MDILSTICEVLKVSPSELLDIRVSSYVENAVGNLDIDDEVNQLSKQFSLLSDKDRDLVKGMINYLSEKATKQDSNKE